MQENPPITLEQFETTCLQLIESTQKRYDEHLRQYAQNNTVSLALTTLQSAQNMIQRDFDAAVNQIKKTERKFLKKAAAKHAQISIGQHLQLISSKLFVSEEALGHDIVVQFRQQVTDIAEKYRDRMMLEEGLYT